MTDARTLAVLRNTSGERFRSVQSAADALQEEQFEDWALDGPRTAAWWLREVARIGASVLARHHTWKQENGVAEESNFNVMHEALSEIIELMSCVDQLPHRRRGVRATLAVRGARAEDFTEGGSHRAARH